MSWSVVRRLIVLNHKISQLRVVSGTWVREFGMSRHYEQFPRNQESKTHQEKKDGRRATVLFLSAVGMLVLSLSYAAVPLYRLFCQAYSYGGTVLGKQETADLGALSVRPEKKIRVRFNADTAASLTWGFQPQQAEVTVVPGETALAFYTATNRTDRPIDGIATYNVVPFEVGQYFNKIQCFCFEEQRLNPGEQVDMPVFFYIDPEFADDPKMEYVNEVTLSYTFFEAREGLKLPGLPFGVQDRAVQ
ncbi:unnamed protein product [Notodromas monacha]|uniref:Cytochrome c oxidase assembly protein COX11, mitochondrial n=1 Tax=Notodromas monacha TaxID=399045 RepID=A0A7R9GEF7_9CRUS|nr:unnamed protein product [Notodromas monacha]CAG0917813.1 unnamed protein product [Notodromas monacha]